jgi:hypothetical protein
MRSISTNNPYVSSVNQTVSSALAKASGAVTTSLNNVTGALGSHGGVLAGIGNALLSAGVSAGGAGDAMASQLSSVISGADGFFDSGSPLRITSDALADRNVTTAAGTNPQTQIPSSQDNTSGGSSISYPAAGALTHYIMFNYADYKRPTPLGDTTLPITGTIVLPLPDGAGIIDNTTATWTEAATGLAGNALNTMGDIDKIKKAGESGKGLGVDAAVYAAMKVAQGLNAEVAGAAESVLGLAPNPAMSQLFQGVPFRSFSFSWTLSPSNVAETNTLRQLISYIKQKQLPTYSGSTTFSFNYPSIVKPAFSSDFAKWVSPFKWCVVKNFNVSYHPASRAPSIYAQTKAPVIVQLQMDLQEMEYVLSADYGGAQFGAAASEAVVKGVGSVLSGINNPPGSANTSS